MKKLIIGLSLLIFHLGLYGQTIDIPDPNFLEALIELNIDTSGDGLIQNIEAEAVDYLKVDYKDINSLEGINHFKNLIFLDCKENKIGSLDLNLPLLKTLNCGWNHLTSLNLNSSSQLTYLQCFNNNIISLDLTNLPLLTHLICGANSFTELDLNSLQSLTYCHLTYSKLTTLNIDLPLLDTLFLLGGKLTSLDLNTPNLVRFDCPRNELTSLDLSSKPKLRSVKFGTNHLTSIDLNDLPVLNFLDCSSNKLTELDLTHLPLLKSLLCMDNELTELNLNLPNHKIEKIFCDENDFESLNFTKLPNLKEIQIGGSKLKYVNMLDDNEISIQNYGGFLGLNYLCADSLELDRMNDLLNLENLIVNEYCTEDLTSFININGSLFYGSNADCFDAIPLTYNVPLEIELDAELSFVHYFLGAEFDIKIPPGSLSTLRLHDLDLALFNVMPESYQINSTIDVDSFEFCIFPTDSIVSNVCLNTYSLDSPASGFEHTYTIDYINLGNVYANGFIRFEYDSNIMEFIDASDSWSTFTNTLELSFSDLLPLEKRTTTLKFLLNSPMDIPPLLGGESLIINCNLYTDEVDLDVRNNFVFLNEMVVNSFDPNDKTCLQGNTIFKDSPINYRIRFENIGTAPARNIIVKDTIDANVFDLASIQVIRSSHPVTLKVEDNVINFQFININLPFEDDANDGFIIFSLNILEEIETGTKIENRASIYFDFNWPIHTNIATGEIVVDADGDGFHNLDDCDDTDPDINPDVEEIPNNDIDEDCDGLDLISSTHDLSNSTISIYPNPGIDIINIDVEGGIEYKVSIYSLDGKMMHLSLNATSIEIQFLPKGLYLLELEDLVTGKKIMERIVKGN